jgi:hypothetical protein
MTKEQERSMYQIIAVLCFITCMFVTKKYVNLKHAYGKAESEKVYYCKEYNKLKCKIENNQ